MTDSFITYSNDYLLLNPIKIGLIGICIAIFVLIILLYNLIFSAYLINKTSNQDKNRLIFLSTLINFLQNNVKIRLQKQYNLKHDLYSLKYLLLTCFIVINSFFFVFFINGIALESNKYAGLKYQSAVDLLETNEFNSFLLYLKRTLPKTSTITLNDPDDPFFLDVKYKFKLAYYLLPITLAKNPYGAQYVLVVTSKSPEKVKLTILRDKKPVLLYSSEHFKLLKLIDKNLESSQQKRGQ